MAEQLGWDEMNADATARYAVGSLVVSVVEVGVGKMARRYGLMDAQAVVVPDGTQRAGLHGARL